MVSEKELINKLHEIDVPFRGFNLAVLSQVYCFEMYYKRWGGNGLLNTSKRLSLDTYLKAIAALGRKRKPVNSSWKVLCVNDVYNRSMIQNLRSLYEEFEVPHGEVICDTRLQLHNSLNLFKHIPLGRYFHNLVKFLKQSGAIRRQINEISTLFGIPRFLIFLNMLESVYVVTGVEALGEKLTSLRSIALNSDVHKVSRSWAQWAQSKNIRTYVLQHGTTVLEYGFLPVSADILFTWGALSSHWFEERGTKPERLVEAGTPKMDAISFQGPQPPEGMPRNILLVLNPIGKKAVLEYLKVVRDARLHTDYNLTIKLHPGSQDNREEVAAVFPNGGARIVKEGNIHQFIKETDVVVTTTSTVGNEAIALGKPLVQIEVKDELPLLDYARLGCCFRVAGAGELITLLKTSGAICEKLPLYEGYIEKYFYKLDGQAARRIAQQISKEE